jgi:hypothetical protein
MPQLEIRSFAEVPHGDSISRSDASQPTQKDCVGAVATCTSNQINSKI